MSKPEKLEYGRFYHVYNRGTNSQNIFFEQRNYRHFLKLYAQNMLLVADTHAYCLLKNHFHFATRIKTEDEIEAAMRKMEPGKPVRKLPDPSQQFGNVCNAYAKAINRAYGRTGSLFEHPFGRKPVTSDRYYYNLIIYIHRNPQLHGFVKDFRHWPWSSYGAILSDKETRLQRSAVLDWFDDRSAFCVAHEQDPDEKLIQHLIVDDFL
jgi:hypothetical protein